MPGLAEPQIETEVTGAANVIALSGLAGQSEAECVNRRSRVPEYVGTAIDHERSAFRFGSNEYGIGSVLPIGRPIVAVINSRWESAGHAIDPCDFPSAEDRAEHAVSLEMLALSIGQLVHEVGIELMGRVEIRWSSVLIRRPGIHDVAGKAAALILADPLSIGTKIDRLGEGVVEIEL